MFPSPYLPCKMQLNLKKTEQSKKKCDKYRKVKNSVIFAKIWFGKEESNWSE
jgi:hypothetical protein